MKILFLGDVHAAWHRFFDAIIAAEKNHGIDAAVQVGDFGFFPKFSPHPWGAGPTVRLPVPTYVIDGNHEDHAWLQAQRASGEVSRWAQEQNLFVQPRGSVVHWDGLTIGFCGGALHADRRQEGSIDKHTTNWLTNREADAAAAAFSVANVDVVVTHSCPHSIGIGIAGNPYLAEDVERYCVRKGFNPGPITDCGEQGLLRLWGQLRHRPREWIFGHFHVHREVVVHDVRFHCIGAIDGSDDRPNLVGYILDTQGWLFSPISLE